MSRNKNDLEYYKWSFAKLSHCKKIPLESIRILVEHTEMKFYGAKSYGSLAVRQIRRGKRANFPYYAFKMYDVTSN